MWRSEKYWATKNLNHSTDFNLIKKIKLWVVLPAGRQADRLIDKQRDRGTKRQIESWQKKSRANCWVAQLVVLNNETNLINSYAMLHAHSKLVWKYFRFHLYFFIVLSCGKNYFKLFDLYPAVCSGFLLSAISFFLSFFLSNSD
jgi:hypothetical protein